MPKQFILALLLLVLLLLSCRPGEISSSRWKAMDRREKVLTIESLRGHERALDRKGGGGRPHSRPAEVYVERIDADYQRGGKGSVNQRWESMADGAPSAAP
jgi:integrase